MAENTIRVNKGKRTDAQYIKALENSNAALSRENRRLIRLRHKETAQPSKEGTSVDMLNSLVTMVELYEELPILATLWSPAKMYFVCHEKRIPHYKLKDRLMFNVTEVREFLMNGIVKITPKTTKQ